MLNEPSVVAINRHSDRLVAVGKQAKRMMGRTPSHIEVVRPLKDGVIADIDVAERMLRKFLQMAHPSRFLAKPRVVVAVPSGTTGVEQRAVREAAYEAGARHVHIIEEPMAAAIGAGLKVNGPVGNMIVDIGGGTTDVAIIAMGGVVVSQSIRVGGDEIDQAIIAYAKKEHGLLLGERTAEHLKISMGSVAADVDGQRPPEDDLDGEASAVSRQVARPPEAEFGRADGGEWGYGERGSAARVFGPLYGPAFGDGESQELASRAPVRRDRPIDRLMNARARFAAGGAPITIRGRDLVTGLPKTAVISPGEVEKAIDDQVQTIVDAVQTTLDQCPAELAGDLLDNGIVLTGGGAMLKGMLERVAATTGMQVRRVEKPLHSVALGAGRCVDRFSAYQDVFLPDRRR
ncbi:rod shape-determining protein MreB [Thermocatellispora tengchongensis]|uniref:Cell shape-determining protein MreB n=1 Tax=Thermocatellispora tengchongensis TaxID=1073253 RepID=A0A840PH08_9ACTN|nr:rod shape-determining protein MreB [Thermocatellispora tengchongensis]